MNRAATFIMETVIILSLENHSALAQQALIPDQTLGSENSIVIPDSQGFQGISAIEGGARRGPNLFHSFSEFGVESGQGVYFHVPDLNVENIFARVTGQASSEILGTLGAIGFDGNFFSVPTDLYLLNSNGIVFGDGSALDLRGSFVGSTFDTLGFSDQSFFSGGNDRDAVSKCN